MHNTLSFLRSLKTHIHITMKLAVVLTLALLHCTFAAPWWSWLGGSKDEETAAAPPKFCKGYECPTYKVIEEFDGYELREYDATVWVDTQMPAMETDFWEDRSQMSGVFMRLFRYITGANEQKQKIDMTVPVVNTHTKDAVYMAFFMPPEHSNPPQPTDSNVRIYRAPKGQFYVKSFSGFAYGIFGNKNYFKVALTDLIQKMEDASQTVDDTMFFTASYNSPWDLFGRHNEVWIPKA